MTEEVGRYSPVHAECVLVCQQERKQQVASNTPILQRVTVGLLYDESIIQGNEGGMDWME
uniref:Uncharacterized protein n=1 Tax=Setaria digitata TaxID=48799 RepID=A0A915PVJ2_9BILA